MPTAHAARCFYIATQVYVVALPLLQTRFKYRFQEALRRAVIQDFRRLLCRIPECYLYRMPLRSPDSALRFVEYKALFVVVFHHESKGLYIERRSCGIGFLEQCGHVGPALFVQYDAYQLGSVPQHETEKFAEPDEFFSLHDFFCLNRSGYGAPKGKVSGFKVSGWNGCRLPAAFRSRLPRHGAATGPSRSRNFAPFAKIRVKKLAFDDKLPNRATGAALSVGKINCAADYYEVR